MELKEIIIPARIEQRSWTGLGRFELSAGDILKIESNSVEHLEFEVPAGNPYRFRIQILIEPT